MNSLMQSYLGKTVELHITDRIGPVTGKLVEIGNDMMVLQEGKEYRYVPMLHMERLCLCEPAVRPHELAAADGAAAAAAELPFEQQSELSYRKTLMSARGVFTELYMTGQQAVYGYVTSIMNDYFVYYSPLFRAVYVSLRHVKYIIPYAPDVTPYSLQQDRFPLQPAGITLARTFDQQLKKLEGQFVVLDLGEDPSKIGLLRTCEYPVLELITGRGESTLIHAEHIKTVHLP